MKSNRKGFTLIELMVTILILVIVFGMLAGIVGFTTKFYSDESGQVQHQESLRLFAVTFEKDVRRLVDEQDYYSMVQVGNVKTYTLGDTTSTDFVKYDFNMVSGEVFRTEGVSTSIIASNIDKIDITTPVLDPYFIHFKVESEPDGRETVNKIDIKIYLRVLKSIGG